MTKQSNPKQELSVAGIALSVVENSPNHLVETVTVAQGAPIPRGLALCDVSKLWVSTLSGLFAMGCPIIQWFIMVYQHFLK